MNNASKTKIFGITCYTRRNINGYQQKEFLKKLYVVKENHAYKKFYLFGVQFLLKKRSVVTPNATNQDGAVILRQIYNFLYYNELAKKMHPLIFRQFKNKYREQSVVLFACGPTANYYKKLNNAIHVGINRAMFRTDIHFDALFMQDAQAALENREFLKKYDAEKFCAYRTYSITNQNFHADSQIVNHIGAKRFFVSDPAHKNPNKDMPDIINPNIAEGVFYNRGGGTVFSALQFILYTHPKSIYLVGCDCTSSGHFYSKQHNKNRPIPDHWVDAEDGKNRLLPNTLKLWHEAAVVIKMLYPDIKVFSINPVGLKGLFEDIYTEDYLKSLTETADNHT